MQRKRHDDSSGLSSCACCGKLDRGHGLLVLGLGALGQEPERRPPRHDAVSVCGAGISSRRLDGSSSIADHRPDVVGTSRHQCGEPGLVAGNRDDETDARRALAAASVAVHRTGHRRCSGGAGTVLASLRHQRCWSARVEQARTRWSSGISPKPNRPGLRSIGMTSLVLVQNIDFEL